MGLLFLSETVKCHRIFNERSQWRCLLFLSLARNGRVRDWISLHFQWVLRLRSYSPLWKWVIAWDQTKRARVYGILWGGAENPEQPPGIMPGHATCCCAQIISRTPMVWHFIEYSRQDVFGENIYVCFWTIIWIWTPIARGLALPIGVVKRAVELIYHLSFLGVKKNMNDEFYTGQRQLRIQEPGKRTLTFLVPKWTVRLTQ